MKSFDRIKNIHGKPYLYRITPYYDKSKKKIMQQSKYIGPVQDGKVVQKTAVTYAYGDLLPLMKAIRDLNIAEILAKVVKEYSTIILTMAINRIISSEALETWYEDSYLSTLYRIDLSSSSISKAIEAIGTMNLNDLFLKEMLNITGDSDVLCYHLMLPLSQWINTEAIEYDYSASDKDLPQVDILLVEGKHSGIPMFYDIFPGSELDVTEVRNTVDFLRSAGIRDVTLVMNRRMFFASNIDYFLSGGIHFIMPASPTQKGVRGIALKSRKTIERDKNIICSSESILFAEKCKLTIGTHSIDAWVYYDPKRDKIARYSFYSALYERIEKLIHRSVGRLESPRDVAKDILGPYGNFVSWKYSGTFSTTTRDNVVSNRVKTFGMMVITFTDDHDSSYVIEQYRKRDSIGKFFLSSKNFIGLELLSIHSMEILKGYLFVNIIALTIRSRMLFEMKTNGLSDIYSIEEVLLELHKLRMIKLQGGREITTEITGKQKMILESFSIKPEQVPTFLKI